MTNVLAKTYSNVSDYGVHYQWRRGGVLLSRLSIEHLRSANLHLGPLVFSAERERGRWMFLVMHLRRHASIKVRL